MITADQTARIARADELSLREKPAAFSYRIEPEPRPGCLSGRRWYVLNAKGEVVWHSSADGLANAKRDAERAIRSFQRSRL